MSPDELAQEFENHDYDYFLDQMLDAVPENIDKREGSIVYDAVAPAAMVIAQQSLAMANLIRQTYVKTAQDEFLDYRAIEHGMERYPATHTEAKASFFDSDGQPLKTVTVGDKFASLGEQPIFYTVTKINEDLTGELVADDVGTIPNYYLGQIIPVTPNDELSFAEITEITAPSRDAETDDHLRERILKSDAWLAYGGNIADYLDMIRKIHEVGAAQVYPVWAGSGTVKLVIVDNDLMPASADLVKKVKNIIDPEDNEAQGVGLAPIDHRVTVVAPEALKVNVSIQLKLTDQANKVAVEKGIKDMLDELFSELRKDWDTINAKVGRGYRLSIYRSRILSKIMLIDGVADSHLPKLNGKDEDIQLVFSNEVSQLPILGEVTISE